MDSPNSFKAKFSRIMLATAAKNESDLARILDIHPSSVGAAKKRNQIPTGWVEKVAEDFNVSSDWLFFGRGQMWAEQANFLLPSGQLAEEIALVPIMEARLAATGDGFACSEGNFRVCPFPLDFLSRKGNLRSMVLVRVSGDSMEPDICDNDIVLIDRSKTELFPGRIYAVGFNECIYLKKIDMLPGKVILKSINPSYPQLEIELSQACVETLRILGRALWCGREFL